jgi:hypothetical protein
MSDNAVTIPVSLRGSRLWRWAVYVIASGAWISGVLWLSIEYPRAVWLPFRSSLGWVPPYLMLVHAIFAVACVWVFGLLFGVHVVARWQHHQNRWSGGILFGAALLLPLSGYYIYHANSWISPSLNLFHWVLGFFAPLAFLLHLFVRRIRHQAGAKIPVL